MMSLLLGDSSHRRCLNRPDYNTRDINYATIKCKKDPYEILKLTMEETNICIRHLSTHKLVAFTNTPSTIVRSLFVGVNCNTFSINNNLLSASGPGIEEVYQLPPELNGDINTELSSTHSMLFKLETLPPR